MAGVWESIFGSPPLQPVQGDPINPAYSRMPSATAPITDVRGQGVGAWMSRPHDQNLQSRNMGGYYNNNIQMGGPAFQWQRAHGWVGRDPPSTTLEPPDYYADPSITAHIRAAQDSAPPDPQRSLQIAGPLSRGMWDGQ